MVIVIGAFGAIAFVLGMFALQRVKDFAKDYGTPVPRIPGLTPEQSFGLGGVAIFIGVILIAFSR
jgi:hypothetical protein